jgi:hypothetical protein
MPTARDHLAAAALDGVVYAVGGRAGGVLFDAVEAFDSGTGRWRTGLRPMPTARGGLMAAVVGPRLYAFGGEGNGKSPLGVFSEVEAYEPATDRWVGLAAMPTPRHGTMAAAIGDAIYVVGGASRQGFGVSGVTEVFRPDPQDVLEVTRARVHARNAGARLRLHGRVGPLTGDPAALPLGVHLLDGEHTLLSQTLAAGSLTPDPRRRRRLRFRERQAAAADRLTRVLLRQRADGSSALTLEAVLQAAPSAGTELLVSLTVGSQDFAGRTPPLRSQRRNTRP